MAAYLLNGLDKYKLLFFGRIEYKQILYATLQDSTKFA